MQVEHNRADYKAFNSLFGDVKSRFSPIEEFDQDQMEAELSKPEVKEVHVFKKGGLAEITAQLRNERPDLNRKKRRKMAKKLLKKKTEQ